MLERVSVKLQKGKRRKKTQIIILSFKMYGSIRGMFWISEQINELTSSQKPTLDCISLNQCFYLLTKNCLAN